MNEDIDSILDEIKNRLIPDGIEKLILFGSYAYGNPTEDSDIDLLVVTSDLDLPKSFSEKSRVYLRIARKVDDIRRRVPVDLIVHTHSMHEKFLELDSMFCRELEDNGRIIYEKNYASVA
jgi:predicted nucleotidyltransferase